MSDETTDIQGHDANLVAYRIAFEGPSTYPLAFEQAGFGLVLDDDGETGYLYITSADFEDVYDSLHIYNSTGPEAPSQGDELHILYNSRLMKAGLYYRAMFWAIIDYAKSEACCRSGQPPSKAGGWCTSSHSWNEKMIGGLTFKTIQHEGKTGSQA